MPLCREPETKSPRTSVLLATCRVQIINKFNNAIIRALIDPGSELSFISNDVVRTNQLQRNKSSLCITGIGGSESTTTRGFVTVVIKSLYSREQITISAHILNRLTCLLPSFAAEQQDWPHLLSLQLADPDYLKPRGIDMIIGADYYGQIIKSQIKTLSDNAPIAQSTIFGWIIIGPITESKSRMVQSYHTSIDSTNRETQELLTKFWIQEEIFTDHSQVLSPDEQECENHFRTTHFRDQSGRYVVRIPLKSSPNLLGDSYRRAYHCVRRMLGKLSNDNDYNILYRNFMKEYEDLHHMKKIEHNSEHKSIHTPYYLPHHGVLREEKITTKLRVVFNGSSPSSSQVSVNDLQYTGAKIQRDISDVLLWIRKHKFLFTADITKMYRQIRVHEEDWDLQRILWIDEYNNIVPYQLTTVTYGTRSAPFLAVRALIQLVEDEGKRYPLAVEPLLKGRYVDDIFGGANSHQDLIKIANQVIQLCLAGGFPLAKWHSNDLNFLKSILQKSTPAQIHSFEDSSTKLLGLSWLPSPDQFKFTSKPSCKSSRISKRVILSETAQLYDPLGFLSPFIIRAKIILQELWLEKLSWDDLVSPEIQIKWRSMREELNQVSEISIQRWLNISSSSTLELHGFSDASQVAMAAAVYIRVQSPDKTVKVTLVCAKSKVAPLKRLSIPRLELGAALILAKLIRYVKQTLELDQINTTCWTDSKVTLSWIKSHPSRWKDFVRNRVSQIQDLTPDCVWSHVPGKDNPADCASRGLTISQLSKHALWWTGPQWLKAEQKSWPNHVHVADGQELIEERPGQSFTVVTTNHVNQWELIRKYSSLIRLLRITAICFRVMNIIKRVPQSTLDNPIDPQDLKHALIYWTKSTQAAYFEREIKQLRSNQLSPSHPFTRLTAFIDTQGVIRVGGRLTKSHLEQENIHPSILPKSSPLTDLIIADAHQKTLHGGTQSTLNYIREKFWILGGRVPVRSYILRCHRCARLRGKRAQQLMGQLPPSRTTPSRPFSVSGVDYAGPLMLKTWKGRGAKKQKGWLCIFVCFVSSAVHLEAVTDYSSDSFIAAFRRFTGRRGVCHTLYSDCGTTFLGADTSLKTLFSQGSKENQSCISSLTNHGTTWKFNPPAAPHMGGKWEAAVKSVKHHLQRTIGDTALTFEELSTLLVQIEAVLNSRPLEPLTEDPEDLSVLTPAHFLIGEPITTEPEPSYMEMTESRLSRWQFIQQRLQYFWAKWSKQYLQKHLSISKWHHSSHEIKIGSLVLISDERLPPTKWPLARVIEIHPGKDGLTRVVTLKTANTTLIRPIAKLAILPSSSHHSNNHQTIDDGGRNV